MKTEAEVRAEIERARSQIAAAYSERAAGWIGCAEWVLSSTPSPAAKPDEEIVEAIGAALHGSYWEGLRGHHSMGAKAVRDVRRALAVARQHIEAEAAKERDELRRLLEIEQSYASHLEGFARVVRNIVDPNEIAADGGVTVFDVLQKEAAVIAADTRRIGHV